MIKTILLSLCLLPAFLAFAQIAPGKYRSVSDSTGAFTAYYLTSDTSRINNPSLLPPGTTVPLYDENENQVGLYVLNNERTWIFTLNKKK